MSREFRQPYPGQTLYRFFDSAGVLLYVGVTDEVATRWRTHAKTRPWWIQVATITLEHHASRAAVLDAELAAIKAERPLYNVAGTVAGLPASPLPSEYEHLLQIRDYLECARRISEIGRATNNLHPELAWLRRKAVEALMAGGWSRSRVAHELAITPSRITGILRVKTPVTIRGAGTNAYVEAIRQVCPATAA